MSILYGRTSRRLPIRPITQASVFHIPNQFQVTDRSPVTKGHPDRRGWADLELVNINPGWQALGDCEQRSDIESTYQDAFGNEFPIPQTMTGVEIDTESDEYAIAF